MNHRIRLKLKDVEGALLRSVGVAQRRGFTITEAHYGSGDAGAAELELAVASPDRSIQVLARQLARLHEVLAVECLSLAAERAPELAVAEVR